MSQRSKRELSEALRPSYLKASKAGKEKILDEFVPATGYHRKYAIQVLRQGRPSKGLKKPGQQKVYKDAIPVRTWAEWNETKPGFLELVLVAHCGDTTAGVYLNTLTAIGIATGSHKTQEAVSKAIG